MLKGYQILDADGHVIEPLDLWTKRLDPQFLPLMPQAQGKLMCYRGQVAMAKISAQQWEDMARRTAEDYKEYVEAGFSAESQVRAMDHMGLDISVLYPSYGLIMWHFDRMEPKLSAALARAYNDWIYEFSSYAPGRLQPVAGLSLHDPGEAVAELRRVVGQLGMRAIFLRPNPVNSRLLSDPAYELLWEECERLGVAVGIHEGAHTTLPEAGAERFHTHFAVHACSHPMEQMMAFLTLLEGGVLERHPTLKFAFLESGSGWLPYWLWRLDELEYKNVGYEVAENVKMKPSEYFRRQCYIAAEPEPYLGALIDFIGEDRVLFASDYPHPDHRPDITDELMELEGLLSKRALRRMLWDNPLAFYRLD